MSEEIVRTNYTANILQEDMTTMVAANVPVCYAYAPPPSQVDVVTNAKDDLATHVIAVSSSREADLNPHYFFEIQMTNGTNYYNIIRTQRVSQFLNSGVIRCLCRLVTIK